jgi:AraC-like DNA-binding protein
MTVRRHESDLGFWENIERAPHESLAAAVLRYQGWLEDARGPAVRRHVPGTGVTVILGFHAPLRNSSARIAPVEHQSFVAGLQESHVNTENMGVAGNMQVDLTALGAHLLFGRPMHELTNTVLSLEDAFGPSGSLLVEALHDASAWDLRFDMLDAYFTARFSHARPASPGVAWAARTIERRHGNVSIASLGERLGWSRKHLVSQFREQIGVPPKMYARIARFRHALSFVRSDEELRWTDVAHACGYYDQAHFIRDFTQFAGVSPTRFLDLRLPLGQVIGDAGA